ncbi:hypothetical protein DB31_4459 [Hyalangium minutum]|uniref:Pesticidal crystal protein Cry22Aa Ig-like domain-containing protein n=1 Tax=Hyalangium minutum TaxID=394096 RepID=A0A085W2V3_9BACT|nr:hypothetical protein DB31_4459 [Hyalangium minutum]
MLATVLASACGREESAPKPEPTPAAVRTTRQEARSDYNKVLILGSSVNGGVNSPEAQTVLAYRPDAQITIVTPEQWALMSANEFSQYHLIIIGDPGCVTGTAPFQAAIENRDVWGPVVDSEVVIVGASTNAGGSQPLQQAGIHQALDNGVQLYTSMYISLGCAYQNAPPNTAVEVLEPFGTFKVRGLSTCADSGHRFVTFPSQLFSDQLFDMALTGADGCATRTVFTEYPVRNLTATVLATDISGSNPIPGGRSYQDYDEGLVYEGTPYVFVRNVSAVGAGCGGDSMNVPDGEECDLGDGFNGQRGDICSFSCRMDWCGDGVLNAGEECDNGNGNQRTPQGDIINGNCSAFCKVVDVPNTNPPPVALCRNVTETVTNQCGMNADINNGSYDPGGEPVTCTQTAAGPYNIGNTTVTLTCSDSSGQQASCTGVVTIKDGVKPVVTIAGLNPQPVECNRNGVYTSGFEPNPAATANDMCSGTVPVSKSGTVNMAAIGAYQRIYTATDAAGNVGTATRTVNVADTLKPVVTTPTTVTPLECKMSTYTDVPPTASDQCAGTVPVTTAGAVNVNAVGTYPLTYTARDPAGNVSDPKVRTVTVRDSRAPSVTLNGPANVPVECNDPAFADPGATGSDVCAGIVPATPIQAVSVGTPGTYTVSYQAVDPSGNIGVSGGSRTFVVSDTLPPVLTMNGAASIPLECANPFTDPGATANDQCAGNVAVTTTGSVNNRVLGAQTLTYSANDGRGHTASATRTVNVRDTQAPTITITGSLTPPPVECGGGYTDPGATANDACAGALPTVAEPPVNQGAPGNYNVRYRATDPSGNTTLSTSSRAVTVQDTLAPVLTLNGSATMGLECATAYTEQGATANDQCAGNLNVTISGTVDNHQLTTQTVTYSANDGSGHTATKTRAVTVRDTLAPAITLNGPLNLPVECGDPTYADPGATANDACAGALPAVPEPPANPNLPGNYVVRYRATDPSGNSALSTTGRTVTVSDTLPPTLQLAGANPQQVECGTAWADPGSAASDQCAGVLTPTVSGGVNHLVPNDYPITYTVSDGHGHTVTANRAVNVRDTLPPSITVNGPANDSFACGATYTDPGASATDACDTNVQVIATQSGNTTTPGTFTITYKARDAAGHEVTSPVQRTVTVSDDAPPTLVLLGNASQVLECPTPFNDEGATANDACYGDVTNRIQVTGSVTAGTPGTYPLTYTVTDPSGQSAPAVTRTVTVQDTQRPQVTVIGELDIPVECGSGTFTDPGATASDACAGTLPAVPSTTANPGAPGTYAISYTATDPSGNVGTSNTSRTVRVIDSIAPQIALTGGNMTLECASPWNDPGATASDQCAGNLAVTASGTVNNRQLGPQAITYTATDGTNQATVSRTVTVNDTLPPTLALNGPANDTFACGVNYVDPGATATDACDTNVVVTATQTGNPDEPGTFIITYSARDASNNVVASPVTRTVTVGDDAPPTLVLVGSPTPSLECGTPFNDPGATANDVCFGDVTGSIQVAGSVNSGTPGSYPLTYTVTDPSGQSATPVTRTVSVQDTLAPAITVLGSLNQQLQCDHSPYADPGATATDACAGNLTGSIQRVGGVNTGAAGSYTLTYRVTDPSGNTATSGDVRTVTVVDNLPPTITLQGGTPAAHECGSPFADPGATANDACAGDLTANINRTGSVDGNVIGQYPLNYTVTDPSGLTANTQRVVNVNDTLAPQLTLVGQANQLVECGPGYQDPGATATDACAGNLDGQIQVSGAANSQAVGNYTVSYSVTDGAGNTAGPLTRNVQVRDTQAPVITVNGALDQQFDCGSAYVDPGATASDVCAGAVPVTATQNGNANQPGTFTISYTATDPSNNTVTSPVTRTVHVNDNLPPTLALVGPGTQRLECGSSFADQGATANDACFGDLTSAITVTGSVNTGVAPRDYTLFYNVTDGAGNSAPSVSRTIEVRDTLAPSITVTGPTNTTYECGSTYADPGATATDACAGNLTSAIVATQTPDPNAPANFIVTYSVTDPSGNTTVSPVTRTVTMNDNLPPTIALNGPAVQSLECAPTPYNDLGATANDSCVGPVPVTVVGSVDMTRNGTYTLTYTARDTVGNVSPSVSRTVNISDTTPPAITLNGSNAVTLECKRDTYTELGATGLDICSGEATVSVSGTVDTEHTGFYLVRYTATDASGNTNQTVRNVNVGDTLPPTIALNGPNPLIMECATPFNDPGATASDLCQGNVSDTVFLEFNGVNNMVTNYGNNPGVTDPYKVRYQANDHLGHYVTLERDVRVQDTRGPVLSVTGAPVSEIECGSQPDLGVVATDACYGNVTVTASPAQLPHVPGEYNVTYTATDPAGNTTVGTDLRHFSVVDTTLPELSVNGPEVMYYECTGHAIGNVWSNPGASATDTCEGVLQVHSYNSGDDDGDGIPGSEDPDDFGPGPTTEVEGLYYVQYMAWDQSYNIQQRILSVYVQDTLPPVLILNGAETVQTQCFFPTDDPTDSDEEVDVDPNPYIDQGATGDDQCYGDVTPLVQTFSTVDKQSPGRYQVEYQVRDGAFNWAMPITRTVQVIDNQAPKLKMNPPIKVFPADLSMRRVDLTECGLAWDRCEGYMDIMDVRQMNVVSNEPAANGDAGDIQFDPDSGTFYVKAKRNTNNTQRVYTATWRNYDASGNFVNGTCKVYVPVNANDPAPSALQSGTDITARR